MLVQSVAVSTTVIIQRKAPAHSHTSAKETVDIAMALTISIITTSLTGIPTMLIISIVTMMTEIRKMKTVIVVPAMSSNSNNRIGQLPGVLMYPNKQHCLLHTTFSQVSIISY